MGNKVFKFEVKIPPSITGIISRLSATKQRSMMRQMGRDLTKDFAHFFYAASRSRHKTANKYGVEPTGILEFDDGFPARSRGGGIIKASEAGNEVTLTVGGVPFLSRAYAPLHIVPKRAHCLTIPISSESVHKRAADLKRAGWVLFSGCRRNGYGRGILFGKRGYSVVALFALVKNATIPQDKGLMPSEAEVGSWAASSAKRFLGL